MSFVTPFPVVFRYLVFQISGIHREEHSWKEPLALQEELQVEQMKFA